MGLLVVANSTWVDRRISSLISRLLSRDTDLAVRDYEAVLHISGDYEIDELNVEAGDWLANERLADLRLCDKGVQVLGITRPDGTFLGVPGGDTVIRANDSLLLYGMADALENLDERERGAEGEAQHDESVRRHQNRQQRERVEDAVTVADHLSRET